MIRVLVTSVSHPAYNQTGRICRDLRGDGVEIILDSSGNRALIPEGQWKIISRQEPLSEEEAMNLALEAQASARQ